MKTLLETLGGTLEETGEGFVINLKGRRRVLARDESGRCPDLISLYLSGYTPEPQLMEDVFWRIVGLMEKR